MSLIPTTRHRAMAFTMIASLGLTLGGCAVGGDPHVSLTEARMVGAQRAALSVMIENKSSAAFVVDSVDWELSQGPLPIATGAWQFGSTKEDRVPAGEAMTFTRIVEIRPPEDPNAPMQLTGKVNLMDQAENAAATFTATAAVNEW